MVSRETVIHVRAVLLGFLALALLTPFDAGPETGPASVVTFLLFYGLVLGGSHLYLALRGEDGMVPVAARWRYLAVLAVLLAGGTAVFYGGERSVGTIELRTIGLVVIVVTSIAYLVTESVAGYRASRSE
ncbi:hypothetical protein [Natronobacterium texcoconense]|uniref:Uncharacterized protein n=1 Tax=Natronobacterium texcoconense TaxID=1095778 RepID=A0A1H1F9S5_NATTX|nr:hypothetical protein [Natronobacterium texcoconense]SDQ97216.1 hypothetical protein SAMN04489842_1865 [Natronobacterium texcoconense]